MLVSRREDTDESGHKGKAAIRSAFIYGKRFAALRKLMAMVSDSCDVDCGWAIGTSRHKACPRYTSIENRAIRGLAKRTLPTNDPRQARAMNIA